MSDAKSEKKESAQSESGTRRPGILRTVLSFVIGFFALTLLGVGIWYVFFREKTSVEDSNSKENKNGDAPETPGLKEKESSLELLDTAQYGSYDASNLIGVSEFDGNPNGLSSYTTPPTEEKGEEAKKEKAKKEKKKDDKQKTDKKDGKDGKEEKKGEDKKTNNKDAASKSETKSSSKKSTLLGGDFDGNDLTIFDKNVALAKAFSA